MNLPLELMILALDDESGKISSCAAGTLGYSLAGAFLMELILQRRIALENKKIVILNSEPLKDDILEDVFLEIKNVNKERNASDWISSGANYYSRFRDTLFRELMAKGIVDRVESKSMKIFTTVRHPIIRMDVKDEILARVQSVLLDEIEADGRLVCLLSLMKTSSLVKSLFDKEHRKEIETKIAEITKNSNMEKAILEAIQAAEAASYAAIFAAIM
jgi:hypothetical protein